MRTLLVITLVLVPLTAQAQTLRDLSTRPLDPQQVQLRFNTTADEHRNRDALNHATWFYVATAASDWSVTAVCAKVVCGDRTITGLFLYGVEDARVAIPLGVASDAAYVAVVRYVVAPEHPTLARVLLYGAGTVRLVFVANKVTDLRATPR